MTDLFLTILNMSITASYIAVAVFLFRFLLKKAPKALTVIMWAAVGIRLIFPFSIESIFSAIPSAKTIPENIFYSSVPAIDSGIPSLNQSVNPIIGESFAPNPGDSINPLQTFFFIAAIVWIIGIAAMLIYTLVSYLKIDLKVREAVNLKDNIYLCDNIASPFIFGIIRPKIYLPSNINESDIEFVTAHEKAHIKRLDHLWKPLGFALLSIYWFNPILWFSYILLCKDIEFACDEAVIKKMGTEIKKPYSEALLNCSVSKRLITACPLAFGETGVKSRIKSVLNYKKPTFWVIITAIVGCIVLSVCFLTNPKSRTLMHIEDVNLSSYLEHTISVQKWDGKTFQNVMSVDKNILNQLLSLKISKNPVSQDRSEDGSRDLSNTVILQTASDLYPSISSRVNGLYISFNKDFTEVYIPYGITKLTLSYHVKDPEKAKEIFENMVTVDQYSHLESEFPEFFNLDASGGLTVYIWEWTPDNFKCALGSSILDALSDMSFAFTKGCTMAEMRAILSSYNIKREMVRIKVVNNPLSSWRQEITAKYQKEVTEKFWGLTSYTNVLVTHVDNLKESHPEYFGLSTQKGLEIYVWLNDSGFYECVLKGGRNLSYTEDDILASKPVRLEIMREIITTYDIDRSMITVHPFNHPKYNTEIGPYRLNTIEFLLFGIASYDKIGFDEWGLKMKVNFIDDSILQVNFEHSQEHQTEVGRLTVTPEYEIRAIYNNQVVSFGDYMRNVLKNTDYKDKIFSWDSVIYTIPSGENYTLTSDLKTTYIESHKDPNYNKLPKGQYLFCKKVRLEDKNGNYAIKLYTAPFTVVE